MKIPRLLRIVQMCHTAFKTAAIKNIDISTSRKCEHVQLNLFHFSIPTISPSYNKMPCISFSYHLSASDGVWEFITSGEAVDIVQRSLAGGADCDAGVCVCVHMRVYVLLCG